MADGLANADDDDPKDAQRTEQAERARQLEGLYIGDEDPGSYEPAEHDELRFQCARVSRVGKQSGDMGHCQLGPSEW